MTDKLITRYSIDVNVRFPDGHWEWDTYKEFYNLSEAVHDYENFKSNFNYRLVEEFVVINTGEILERKVLHGKESSENKETREDE